MQLQNHKGGILETKSIDPTKEYKMKEVLSWNSGGSSTLAGYDENKIHNFSIVNNPESEKEVVKLYKKIIDRQI